MTQGDCRKLKKGGNWWLELKIQSALVDNTLLYLHTGNSSDLIWQLIVLFKKIAYYNIYNYSFHTLIHWRWTCCWWNSGTWWTIHRFSWKMGLNFDRSWGFLDTFCPFSSWWPRRVIFKKFLLIYITCLWFQFWFFRRYHAVKGEIYSVK